MEMAKIRMQAKGLYQAGNMEAAKAFNNMADAYELLANEYGRVACQAGLVATAQDGVLQAISWISRENRPSGTIEVQES